MKSAHNVPGLVNSSSADPTSLRATPSKAIDDTDATCSTLGGRGRSIVTLEGFVRDEEGSTGRVSSSR